MITMRMAERGWLPYVRPRALAFDLILYASPLLSSPI